MSVNCILLYGNPDRPVHKSAGVFRIATELRNNGYTVQCIDLFAFGKINDEFKQVMNNFCGTDTLWVGLSTTFFGTIYRIGPKTEVNDLILNFIEYMKEAHPNIKLLAGGVMSESISAITTDNFKIFTSYSDTEIVDYTKYLSSKSLANINFNIMAPKVEGSEFKEFHTSKILYQDEDIVFENDVLPIEVSRGCIFKCKFCSFPLNGKKKGEWIKRPDILLDEFNRNYENWGVTDYMFVDDTYNDTFDKVKSLYDDVFSKLKFKVKWTAFMRLDLIMRKPEMAEYLVQSGAENLMFGIESIDLKSAKSIGKGVPPDEQFAFLRQLKQNEFKNVNCHSNFIVGLPYDSVESCERTRAFLMSDQNPLDSCQLGPLFMNPKKFDNKSAYSDFDLEFDKYGYEVTVNSDGKINWVNKKTGLTSKYAEAFANQTNKLLQQKVGVHSWVKSYYINLGVNKDHLQNLTADQIHVKYDIMRLIKNKKTDYVSRVLALSEIMK